VTLKSKTPGLVGDDFDRQRIVLGPEMLDRLETFKTCAASRALGHLRGGAGRAPDGVAQPADLCTAQAISMR
jgi:hypothetical protein